MGVCSRSDEAELEWLDKTKVFRSYRAGSTVALMGDELAFVGTIMQGHASLSRIHENGDRQTVGLMHPGHFIGRPDRKTVYFDIEAITDIQLCTFDHTSFQKVLDNAPHLQSRLVEYMLDELDAARNRMLLLGRKSAREKVASYLVDLCLNQYKPEDIRAPNADLTLDLLLTGHQISDYLSVTYETVSRNISALARDGLVANMKTKRKVRIVDFPGLFEASGSDDDGGVYA